MGLIFSIITCVFLGVEQTSDWIYLGTAGDGSVYYVKPAYTENFERKIWVKHVGAKISYDKNGVEKFVNGYEILLEGFNCSKRTIKFYQMTTYDSKGNAIYDNTFDTYGQTDSYVVPESISEAIMNFACE